MVVSNCCNAPVTVDAKGENFVCNKCKDACDVHDYPTERNS